MMPAEAQIWDCVLAQKGESIQLQQQSQKLHSMLQTYKSMGRESTHTTKLSPLEQQCSISLLRTTRVNTKIYHSALPISR